MIGIDALEARAIYNRTGKQSHVLIRLACTCISDLVKMYREYKENALLERFKSIILNSLMTKPRLRQLMSNIEAIAEVEQNYQFHKDRIVKKNRKVDLDDPD